MDGVAEPVCEVDWVGVALAVVDAVLDKDDPEEAVCVPEPV